MSNDRHRLYAFHLPDGHVGLDHLHMAIAKVTHKYDGGCGSINEDYNNELRASSNQNHNFNEPNYGNNLSSCVSNLRCVIGFANLMLHLMR